MSELGPDDRRALAAFAEVYTPAAADTRAALARVRARIERGEVVDDAEPERAPARSGRWITIGAVVLAIAAAVALAMRLDLASMLASEVDDNDPEAAYAQPEEPEAQGEAIDREPPPVE